MSNFDTWFLTKCLTNFVLSNIIEIFRKNFTILQLRTVRGWRTFSGIFKTDKCQVADGKVRLCGAACQTKAIMKKPEIIYNINDLTCLTSASDADVIPQELLRTNHPDCDKTRQLQGTTLEKSTQNPFNRMTMRQKQDLYTRRMIRFSLKNPAQPLTPIRMRMTINHVRMSYALAPTFKIEPKNWDSTEGRAIVDSKRNADLKGNPRLRVRLDNINTEIDKITNAILAVLARFQQQGIRASADQVRNELQRELGQEASKARTFRDVFEYIDFYINACREGTILNSAGTRLTPGTIRSYLSTKSALRRYAEARHIRLTLESLTLDFYNDFVKYLNEATHSRGRYRPNVIGKFVKNIRTFLRYAFRQQLYAQLRFQAPRIQGFSGNGRNHLPE